MNLLRHYFAVDTTYVLKKLKVSDFHPTSTVHSSDSAHRIHQSKTENAQDDDGPESPRASRNRVRACVHTFLHTSLSVSFRFSSLSPDPPFPPPDQIILFPFMHKNWHREKDVGDGGHPYSAPRDCVNAPDLYLPVRFSPANPDPLPRIPFRFPRHVSTPRAPHPKPLNLRRLTLAALDHLYSSMPCRLRPPSLLQAWPADI